MKRLLSWIAISLLTSFAARAQTKRAPTPEDLFAVKDVADARLSPDGTTVAFTVTAIDRARNTYDSHVWTVATSSAQPLELTSGAARDSSPRWSPDGKKIAFVSNRDGKAGLWIVDVTRRETKLIATFEGSNSFLSKAAEMFCWSPDGRELAFVAAEKSLEQSTDPRVIARAQFKSRMSFSDNRRTHIFVVSAAGGQVRQLTRGNYDEHSIAWSPQGDEILFLSNRHPDPDLEFDYDLFAVTVTNGVERRLASTVGVEMYPSWSPDGNTIAYIATKRKVTTIDSVAEDAHVWVMEKKGGEGQELTAALDRRAGAPQWSADGRSIYFLAGDHGRTSIYRVGRDGGQASAVLTGGYQINSFSVAKDSLAFTLSTDVAPSEVFTSKDAGGAMRQLSNFNKELMAQLNIVKPENIRFQSFDNTEVEGWVMKPSGLEPGKKSPLILEIHGGPHGMYGYGFNLTNQIYAARGYGVLYMNPRGSSGYGQAFSDGCVNNWGGGDYQDLMKGVDYALANNNWIDQHRLGVTGGSYGGFMTNWVITQTDRFKVAVSVASLSNLISFYGTSLYQDLIHAEFPGATW